MTPAMYLYNNNREIKMHRSEMAWKAPTCKFLSDVVYVVCTINDNVWIKLESEWTEHQNNNHLQIMHRFL